MHTHPRYMCIQCAVYVDQFAYPNYPEAVRTVLLWSMLGCVRVWCGDFDIARTYLLRMTIISFHVILCIIDIRFPSVFAVSAVMLPRDSSYTQL